MTARILSLLLLFSTLTFAQNLPDAPKPKPPAKSAPLRFLTPVKKHPRIFAATGLVAVAGTFVALALRDNGKRPFITACACPAIVPKK